MAVQVLDNRGQSENERRKTAYLMKKAKFKLGCNKKLDEQKSETFVHSNPTPPTTRQDAMKNSMKRRVKLGIVLHL